MQRAENRWTVAGIAALLLAAASSALITGCGGATGSVETLPDGNEGSEDMGATALVVAAENVATAELRGENGVDPVEVPVQFVGRLHPVRTTMLNAWEAGRVVGFGADGSQTEVLPGTRVAEGDIVVALRNEALELEVAQTRGQFDQASYGTRAYEEAYAEANSLAEVPDLVSEQEAAFRNAQQDLQRVQRLRQNGSVPATDLEAAQLRFAQAQSGLELQKLRIQNLRESLTLLERRRDLLNIRAPFAGRIVSLDVEVGEQLAKGAIVAELIDDSHFDLTFAVPERYAALILGAMTGEDASRTPMIRFATGAGETLQTMVSATEPRIDPATNTLSLQARIVRRPGLVAGAFIDGTLTVPAQGLFVPTACIQLTDGDSRCYVITADGRIEPRTVRVGIAAAGRTRVISGLSAGESIFVASTYSAEELTEGRMVRIAAPTGSADGETEVAQ